MMQLPALSRAGTGVALGAALLAAAFFSLGAGALAAENEEAWLELKPDLFGDRVIHDGSDWMAIEAPYRAYDAALVPIDLIALKPQQPESYLRSITLVIDQNPAPLAAVFYLGPDNGIASLSTRVRINAYSYVRAIAESNDGTLYMVSRFVKASGGCAAPASKDHDEAMANLGKMRLRQFSPKVEPEAASGPLREVQLMIRHPNYSGFQVDQLTQYYIPAHFVDEIEVRVGGRKILGVEGAISLSENPSIRFHYLANGGEELSVRATDTEGNVFSGSWKVEPGPGIGS